MFTHSDFWGDGNFREKIGEEQWLEAAAFTHAEAVHAAFT
jgi:hypothetical protein